ncbi:MAG: hypothetical protein AAF961_16140 [Planctomycetota bacterium]
MKHLTSRRIDDFTGAIAAAVPKMQQEGLDRALLTRATHATPRDHFRIARSQWCVSAYAGLQRWLQRIAPYNRGQSTV